MDKRISIAAVCGNEVRIYGPKFNNEARPLLKLLVFPHRGAALQYALAFEEEQRKSEP